MGQTRKDFVQASEIHSELLFRHSSCYSDTRGVTAAQIETYPTSRKRNLNQDKSTYTSGEQEKLVELSNFNLCSILQS
jgi:hypothetical protein